MAAPLRSTVASASRSSSPRFAVTCQARRHAATSYHPIEDFTLPFIKLGPTHTSRYHEHYNSTLSADMMYMTYNHGVANRGPTRPVKAKSLTPFEANRPGKMQNLRPKANVITPHHIPKLDSIVVHTYVREAISSKHNLLSAIQAVRAITGESKDGGGRVGSTGIQIVKARQGAASFRLRKGQPIGVKVVIKGEAMYDFIQSLVDFVLPRLRDYPGLPIPAKSASRMSNSAVGGTVSVGFPSLAMQLFPQIEPNVDSYPRTHGFHVHFLSNQRGPGAEEATRALLSGFRIPFFRR